MTKVFNVSDQDDFHETKLAQCWMKIELYSFVWDWQFATSQQSLLAFSAIAQLWGKHQYL
jgi:hypothetical protein